MVRVTILDGAEISLSGFARINDPALELSGKFVYVFFLVFIEVKYFIVNV